MQKLPKWIARGNRLFAVITLNMLEESAHKAEFAIAALTSKRFIGEASGIVF